MNLNHACLPISPPRHEDAVLEGPLCVQVLSLFDIRLSIVENSKMKSVQVALRIEWDQQKGVPPVPEILRKTSYLVWTTVT